MLIEPSEFDRAYAAGLVDGEGCIGVYLYGIADFKVVVRIANTNYKMVEWLSTRFGGKISSHRRKKENQKDWYSWRLMGKYVDPFLVSILPYLVIKQRQAKLALIACRTIGEKALKLDESEKTKRLLIIEKMRDLNMRGSENAS